MQSLTTRIFSANYEGQSGIGTHCRCHLMHCTNSRNRDLRQAENACLPWPFWCAATSAGGLASCGRGHFRACWRLLHAPVEKNSEMLLQCCCRARVQLGQQLLEWLLENKTPVTDMLPRVRIFCSNSACTVICSVARAHSAQVTIRLKTIAVQITDQGSTACGSTAKNHSSSINGLMRRALASS